MKHNWETNRTGVELPVMGVAVYKAECSRCGVVVHPDSHLTPDQYLQIIGRNKVDRYGIDCDEEITYQIMNK